MGFRKDFDLSEIKRKLENKNGKEYWRSLEELAGTEEFQKYLQNEFPDNASEWRDGISRRNFLRLMGASMALAGVTACTKQPVENIIPYTRQPEELIPGRPLYFATSMTLSGVALGLLVESHMGRPTKVEGSPDHPGSLGATDVYSQAAILGLYDPDRSQAVIHAGEISSWSSFLTAIRTRMAVEKARPNPGSGLRILTESITSPSLGNLLNEILQQSPGAKWHQYEPALVNNHREGNRLAFGQYSNVYYNFNMADVVVSLDSDFLTCGAGSVRYTRDFSARRRVSSDKKSMNRLYAFQSVPNNTAAMADHRFPVRASDIAFYAREIAARLGASAGEGALAKSTQPWMDAMIKDLQAHRSRSIVIAGDHQPPEVHALVHSINRALGNTGTTVIVTSPLEVNPVNHLDSLRELVEDMHNGVVDTLLILGGNPVYDAPADFYFEQNLQKVNLRIHLSLYQDETSYLCHWHIPETHFLESWGDARAYDGTVSMIQPLIAPLYGGKNIYEVLTTLTDRPERSNYMIVRDFWQKQLTGGDFEQLWRKALHDGIIRDALTPTPMTQAGASSESRQAVESQAEGLEIIFRPDPTVYDGRFANNAWLQELPKNITKLTWDNAACIAPATAAKLQLKNEDLVELEFEGRKMWASVWIVPGHAEESVSITLGYGRKRAGRAGTNTGFNAYSIRTSKTPWFGKGLKIKKTGRQYKLACTQDHQVMENRNLVRAATLEEFLRHPEFAHEEHVPHVSLYPEYKYEGYAWGMAIDLNACTGCQACVVACVSENNIPVVGKSEVQRGREMHWLRIDRYYAGDLQNPETYHQPVPCMHCENAPCEVVCPVNATVHSSEGLNDMVYNRCVGTRYCSNNCPYKVRRFNFFLYSNANDGESVKLGRNPDVSVRSRGVMEKCTYCVQRINAARIDAKNEGRKIQDGEVVTACAQACPAEAIVFGDINDANSKVAKLKAEQRNYGLLADLNTKPRTTYLAALRNPNPAITPKKEDE